MPESPRPQRHDSPASGTTAGPAEFLHSTLGYQLIQRGGGVQFSIWTYMPHVAIVARPVLAAAPVLRSGHTRGRRRHPRRY
jgi:hypothetical protein